MLKSKLENELILSMNHELVKKANNHDYDQLHHAVDYINSAIDILESSGFQSQANKLLNLIYKIATFEKIKANFEPAPLQFYKKINERGFQYGGKDIFGVLNDIQKSDSEIEKNKYKALLNNLARTNKNIIANIFSTPENILTKDDVTEQHFKEILEENYMDEDKAMRYVSFFTDLSSSYSPSDKFWEDTDALGFTYKGKKSKDIINIINNSDSELNKNKYKAILTNVARSEGSKFRIASLLNKDVENLTEEDFQTILGDNYLTEQDAAKHLFFEPRQRKNVNFSTKDYYKIPDLSQFSEAIERSFPTESQQALASVQYYLNKLAKKRKPKNPTKVSDSYTKNLTSKKMIKNLKGHGTVFNMPDINMADDILSDHVFEEEP